MCCRKVFLKLFFFKNILKLSTILLKSILKILQQNTFQQDFENTNKIAFSILEIHPSIHHCSMGSALVSVHNHFHHRSPRAVIWKYKSIFRILLPITAKWSARHMLIMVEVSFYFYSLVIQITHSPLFFLILSLRQRTVVNINWFKLIWYSHSYIFNIQYGKLYL